jgi:myo-inositol-1(or 4)-monophosphatase
MALKTPIINIMTKAAYKAGNILIKDFREVENLQVSKKGIGDFVTSADLNSEKTIIKILQKAYPKIEIMSEETSPETNLNKHEKKWIIDPLDGTLNFIHGLPHFAISIALMVKEELISGVIYDPIKDELFWAEKGVGAFLNEKRIRVSARNQLKNALVSTGIPWKGMESSHKNYLKILENIMKNSSGIRRYGSASLDLAYVAAGRYDAFWEFNLKTWDIAAGVLLVKEAGGHVGNINKNENFLYTGNIYACNNDLIDELESGFIT